MEKLNTEYKKALKAHCKSLIVGKVKSLEEAMESAQQSANAETRSTAGDKHDTARAMMHLEKEKMGTQLSQNLQLLKVIEEINDTKSDTIKPGSFIKTDKGLYYLLISIGQVKFEKDNVFVISAQSPIGKIFIGKSTNEKVKFNGNEMTILEYI
ncbi:3-oxoacyl-ACP synthase [Flammeovirga sp. EKP202]|uniref:3-oxoacyl-ACP synthase n=1 Tax=Flammeovirga sp. EKP202 TaxID=2770592 RepID=UPI00165EE048|nr:3-oxoacyl-ACP synthase [Flammeovirga sp. EKP202]MBD0402176.1 3-oxoacyl-ACP synthase [Flammeovirga sp. EKP202]